MMPTVPRDSFLVIRTDGHEEVVPFPAKKGMTRLDAMKQALGFDTFDFIALNRRGRGPVDLVMVVDDQGYETRTEDHGGDHFELVPVQARKPVNPRATELYHAVCLPGTTHQIVGDVAILHDAD